jgi:hypothetical protein
LDDFIMPKQLQSLLVRAPAFEGLNTEDSPLGQNLNFAQSADNAVIDRLGRLGSRLAFAKDTDTIDVSYGDAGNEVVRTDIEVMQIGGGDVNGKYIILCTVKVEQLDEDSTALQTDYFVCRRDGTTLTELSLPPGIPGAAQVGRAKIIYFNDKLYVFSNGNPALIYDDTADQMTFMSAEPNWLPPQDDSGNLADEIDGDIVYCLRTVGCGWLE